MHHTWKCPSPLGSRFCIIFLLTIELFFFLGTVNPTKCCCPFALKMAACQLLLEITTFLRETFPYMPRPRTEPLVVSELWKLERETCPQSHCALCLSEEGFDGVITQGNAWCREKGAFVWWEDGRGTSHRLIKTRLEKQSMYQKSVKASK